jgi:hypothetical protein
LEKLKVVKKPKTKTDKKKEIQKSYILTVDMRDEHQNRYRKARFEEKVRKNA